MAAGKSEALKAFGRLGAATVSADVIVHDLLDRPLVLARLKERWGPGVEHDGRVDRAAVGQRVFGDPDELAWLESQIHPLVQDEIEGWIAGLDPGTRFAVAEVPLLFEGEMADRFDRTVAVIASEAIRQERARGRGQVGIEGREGRQLSQQDKAGRADFVIENDGSPAQLEARIAELLDGLGPPVPTSSL